MREKIAIEHWHCKCGFWEQPVVSPENVVCLVCDKDTKTDQYK